MELTKTKFKQTEVGFIPDDWENIKVNDLLELLTDYDANGSFSSVAENVNVYDSYNFAWYVRSTDLEKKSNLNDVRYVDKSSYRFLKKTALYGGELLFLKRGDIGRVYLFEMKTDYATVAPNLYLLKLNKLTIPSYLFYYFKSDGGQRQLKSKNASSTLGALYKDDVKAINVPLPPLPEQKAIAQVLSDTDNLIQAIEQKLSKKRAIKQGAMQQLLTPKEDWEVKTLGEIFEITAGGDLKKDKFSKSKTNAHKYPIYSNAHKNKGLYGFSSSFDYEGSFVTISARGGIGFTVYRKEKFNAIGRLLILKPTIKVSCKYIEEFINLRIEFSSESTGVPQLTAPQVSKYLITLPEVEKQKEIATILSDIDAEIEQLEQKLSKYKMLKQGLMQNLLTGKIRLV